MMRMIVAALAIASLATAASAQVRLPRLPVILPIGGSEQQPPPPPGVPGQLPTPGALQADLVVKAGTDTVYFSRGGSALDANAVAALRAQAAWLLANPFVNIRLEGHGDARDSRDFAIAIGDKRANEVRDFLMLQGVAPHRITVTSWGKERPGSMRIGTSTVAAGPRVVTKIR